MFCSNCGNEIPGKFCANCGKGSVLNSIQHIKKFDEFIKAKKQERRTFFHRKKQVDKRKTNDTTIFASLMKRTSQGTSKRDRGTRLPIKVNVDWGVYRLKEAVFEKFERYNDSICGRNMVEYDLA